MEWNNGKERAKFERKQAELRVIYLAQGMTEEQIQMMYDFDNDYFNECRREAEHTQELDVYTGEDEDNKDNPLIKKFIDSLTRTDKHFENDRYGWIEQIEDESISKALRKLSDEAKDLLTLIVVDGLNQCEIAERLGVSHQAISKKFKKIKTFFEKWLQK